MFNAQRYMCKNDPYVTLTALLRELQYYHGTHPHHFTLDLHQLDRKFEYRFIQIDSFVVTNVELEYIFDTMGFLWLHHDSPPYLLYLLEKLADGLSEECVRPPPPLPTITTTP